MNNTLPRSSILRGRKAFFEVLSGGRVFLSRPVRTYYILEKAQFSNVQAGFTVSRSVRRAPDRNKLKRRMRESYRLLSELLRSKLENGGQSLKIVFLYSEDVENRARNTKFSTITASIQQAVHHILSKL